MNRKRFTLIVSLLALLSVLALSAYAQDSEPSVSTTTVHRMSDASEIAGSSSQLTRYPNGVTATLSTSDLEPGTVYTVWWVIFNSPENCTDGQCSLDDIFVFADDTTTERDDAGNRVLDMDNIAASNISVQHASGSVSADGSLAVSASLGRGEVPGVVFGPGLLDPYTAEVHLVVRTHGPAVADAYEAQLSTFGGGCEPMDAAPCDDVQFVIHMPAGM
ncbi:MAG: hypothetical protein IPK19_20925 [Chloroflexi bacterium]|nr:hypothetical protein [Chloroflexota bacterium]